MSSTCAASRRAPAISAPAVRPRTRSIRTATPARAESPDSATPVSDLPVELHRHVDRIQDAQPNRAGVGGVFERLALLLRKLEAHRFGHVDVDVESLDASRPALRHLLFDVNLESGKIVAALSS